MNPREMLHHEGAKGTRGSEAMHSTPLNILLTNSTDIYAGGEFFVFSLARELRSRGRHVSVACKPGNLLRAKCEQAGIPVFPVDFPPQGDLRRYVGILRRLIRSHAIGIVHTNANYDRTAGAFAALLEGSRHVTNVHSFHSVRHNLTHRVRNGWATDHFIVDGVCVKNLLAARDGIPPSKISLVYPGVDPQEMVRNDACGLQVRREFGLAPGEIVIGTVARMVPFKGHEYLLKAFAITAPRFPEARLLLVGDGECENDLRSLAASLGVRDRVVFAGFRDDLPAVYSAFDLYVHPSVEGGGETFPFAVLQALSQQLPVLATGVGDVPQMVRQGVTGFVVPHRDVEDLADKLAKLLGEEPLRRAMGKEGRSYLLERFTAKKMGDAVLQVYSTLDCHGG